MSDTSTSPAHQKLGVGAIVGESFSILFGNLIPIAIACFVPIVIGLLVSGLLIGMPVALGMEDPNFLGGTSVIIGFIASTLFQVVVYGVIIAVLVQLAYDAKLSRPISYKKYASAAIATIVPNVVQMIIIGILAGIGFMLVIIPGLWIYGVYCVVVPAIVIERAGFGAMRRSQDLTKEYRWPVIGAIVLILICATLINMAAVFGVGLIVAGLGTFGIIAAVILQGILFSITYGLTSISVALIYARLREIKEGVGVDSLVAVFE